MALALKFAETSASETPSSTGSHLAAAGSTSPIELDASQEARCKHTTPDDRINYEECAWATRALALVSSEPKDKMWAYEMESDLREWVGSLTSDGFILRNVECRLSWCIVEVGSKQRRILHTSAQNARKWKLFELRDLFAPDIDNPSVLDQLIFYKRYCVSEGELFDGNGHLVPNFVAVGKKCAE